MTTEQLRLRYVGTLTKHWRSSIDRSGPTPALLDELVHIAEEHASAQALARLDHHDKLAAAVKSSTVNLTPEPAATEPGGSPSASHRTRTRTRKGEPA